THHSSNDLLSIMRDRVFIRDLLLRAIIGINDDERINKQDVLINIELETDTRQAAESDDIERAVNYRDIAKETIELVEGSQFFLFERLAQEIANICLADERVHRARVTVEKPTAVRFARRVGVTIERGRNYALCRAPEPSLHLARFEHRRRNQFAGGVQVESKTRDDRRRIHDLRDTAGRIWRSAELLERSGAPGNA